MKLAELTVPAERLSGGEALSGWPCVFVSARESGSLHQKMLLPPCPVVLIGQSAGVDAQPFDLVIPDERMAAQILASVLAAPHAAAVTTELLRILPALSLTDGLVAESLAYGVLQGSGEFANWLGQRPQTAPQPEGRVELFRDGDCLQITLDREIAGNAIDASMRDALAEAFELAVHDRTIRLVRLNAKGHTFSLGADLSEFGTTRDPATAHAIRRQTLPARFAALCGDRTEVRVQGACVGAGLELGAFAHRISASPRAWFQLPELAMGLLPGAGGCVSLTRRIGRQKTALLYLTGKRISAGTALDWGLVDEVSSNNGGPDIG